MQYLNIAKLRKKREHLRQSIDLLTEIKDRTLRQDKDLEELILRCRVINDLLDCFEIVD